MSNVIPLRRPAPPAAPLGFVVQRQADAVQVIVANPDGPKEFWVPTDIAVALGHALVACGESAR